MTIDELAQEIRRVDGNNSLGAGALAEALMPFLEGRGHNQADTVMKVMKERGLWPDDEMEGFHLFHELVDKFETPEPPCINAVFEVEEKGFTGSQSAPVKRIEREDDGSFTVVIDFWPWPY